VDAREPVQDLPVEVDLTLIDEMLRMSVLDRLRLNDQLASTIEELQESFAKIRDG
jgi:hypothetical protein